MVQPNRRELLREDGKLVKLSGGCLELNECRNVIGRRRLTLQIEKIAGVEGELSVRGDSVDVDHVSSIEPELGVVDGVVEGVEQMHLAGIDDGRNASGGGDLEMLWIGRSGGEHVGCHSQRIKLGLASCGECRDKQSQGPSRHGGQESKRCTA